MKLNLLPTYVSKEKSAKAAWFISAIIAIAGVGLTFAMMQQSKNAYDQARENAVSKQAQAALAVATAKQADTVIAMSHQLIVNIDLAKAMMEHNNDYADLYSDVQSYLPSFFRLTSISATPTDATSCVVTMQGVIRTYQNYADLMLALLRIPDAATVSRNGYQVVDRYVPPLTEGDQTARAVTFGQPNIPDNVEERIEYFQARSAPTGYVGQGGFGSGEPGLRGSMEGWQAVTVSVVLTNRQIQTPDPRATLRAAATNSGGGTQPAGGVPGPGPRNVPTGPPTGAGPDEN